METKVRIADKKTLTTRKNAETELLNTFRRSREAQLERKIQLKETNQKLLAKERRL